MGLETLTVDRLRWSWEPRKGGNCQSRSDIVPLGNSNGSSEEREERRRREGGGVEEMRLRGGDWENPAESATEIVRDFLRSGGLSPLLLLRLGFGSPSLSPILCGRGTERGRGRAEGEKRRFICVALREKEREVFEV